MWPSDRTSQPPVGTTLKLRLILLITSLLALVTFAGGTYVIGKAREDISAETRSTLILTSRFLDSQVEALTDEWAAHGYSPPRFRLRELGSVRHLRVEFADPRGHVLETNHDAELRPSAPEWFAALIRRASPPAPSQTRLVTYGGTEVGRLTIAADPGDETEEIWTTCRTLGELLLCFFIVVNALVWWAASRAMRPVARILSGLHELSSGNLGVRLPTFGLPELTRISIGFNRMAETLERSVMENQRLTRRLLETQESERTSIARELHDEIGQCISAIHADAAAIRNRGGDLVRESAQAIVDVTVHIKLIVRSMLQRLRPPILEDMGLAAALRDLAAVFRQRNPQVACALTASGDLGRLDAGVSVAVYRVIQECLTNIGVHANARRASVDVVLLPAAGPGPDDPRPDACLRVAVADDGVGFFLLSANEGFGLTGIKERIELLGGSCDIDTRPGQGTRISLDIPIHEDLREAAP